MIEIWRIDISTEVSLLSRYLSQPRNDHLHQALHMVTYLKNNECMELCYDPTKINIQDTRSVVFFIYLRIKGLTAT